MDHRRPLGKWQGLPKLACVLELHWQLRGDVVLDEDQRLLFPEIERVPGVYRLTAQYPDGRLAKYIGESQELRRRFRNYRNPGSTQITSRRIHCWLNELLAAGGNVSLSIAGTVRVDRNLVDLSQKQMRRMFEQLAIVLEQANEVESFNR